MPFHALFFTLLSYVDMCLLLHIRRGKQRIAIETENLSKKPCKSIRTHIRYMLPQSCDLNVNVCRKNIKLCPPFSPYPRRPWVILGRIEAFLNMGDVCVSEYIGVL